jgi:hypothetical protein
MLAQIRALKKGWTWCPGRMEWGVARGWLRTVDLGSKTRQINKRVPFGGYRRYVDIFILPIPQALLFWDHTIVV